MRKVMRGVLSSCVLCVLCSLCVSPKAASAHHAKSPPPNELVWSVRVCVCAHAALPSFFNRLGTTVCGRVAHLQSKRQAYVGALERRKEAMYGHAGARVRATHKPTPTTTVIYKQRHHVKTHTTHAPHTSRLCCALLCCACWYTRVCVWCACFTRASAACGRTTPAGCRPGSGRRTAR